MRLPTRLPHVFAGLFALAMFAGCTQLDWKRPAPWLALARDKPQTPTNVVAVWTELFLEQPGGPPTRGFGGRLTFYGPKDDAPVRVEGSLVVYAFEGGGDEQGDAKPLRKYAFTAEQLASHYSPSKLGPSYSVWLPWDHRKGPMRRIGLICRFQPVEGPPIVSKQALAVLHGPSKPDAGTADPGYQADSSKSRSATVLPVAHHASTDDGQTQSVAEGSKRPQMKTTTIPIAPQDGRLMPVAQTRSRARSKRVLERLAARQHAATSGGGGSPPARPPTVSLESPRGKPRSTDCRPGGPPAPGASSAPRDAGRDPSPPCLEAPQFRSPRIPPSATGSEPSSTLPIVLPEWTPF
jgi:hypothetical protein